MDPSEKSDNLHVESLYHLENGLICYRGPAFIKGARALPSLKGTPITFGSLNSVSKLSDRVVALWSRILLKAQNARLLWTTRQFMDEELKEQTVLRFLAEGEERNQLMFSFFLRSRISRNHTNKLISDWIRFRLTA